MATKTEICRCKGQRGAVGLSLAPENKKGVTVWVCSKCMFPMEAIWNGTICRCEMCLDEFSSPWENICEKCHLIENSTISLQGGRYQVTPHPDAPSYRGWAWGKAVHLSGERERRERQIQEHGPIPQKLDED